MQIFELFGTVVLKDKPAQDGLDDIDDKAKKTGGTLGKFGKGAAIAGAAVGAAVIGAGAAMIKAAGNAGDYADRILDLNAITGMTTDSIQEWQHVTKIAGVDLESVTKASSKLTKTMNLLEEGAGKQTDAMSGLGLSYQDIESLSPDEQMNTLMDALAGVEDAGERARIGTDLFGGSWQDLAPIVAMGADGMADAKAEAHELGTVLGEDALNDANNYRIEMEKVQAALGGFATQIGAKAAPMLTNVLIPAMQAILPHFLRFMEVAMEVATKVIEYVGMIIAFVKTWVADNKEQINSLVDGFKAFIEYIKEWVTGNTDSFNAVKEGFMQFVTLVKELIVAFVTFAVAYWDKYGAQIMSIAKIAFDTIVGVIKGAFNIIKGALDFFIGLFTGDWERMGEGLKKIWSGLWEAIGSVLSGAWNILKTQFSFLWDKISGWFGDLKDKAVDWGKNMIQGFIDGIGAMIGNVKKAVTNVMDSVAGFLGFNSPAKEGEGRNITKWGANMIDGFLDGAKDMIPDAQALMNNVVGSMEPQGSIGGMGSSVTFNFERMLEGANLSVRNDQDIPKLARELGNYIKAEARRNGVVMG